MDKFPPDEEVSLATTMELMASSSIANFAIKFCNVSLSTWVDPKASNSIANFAIKFCDELGKDKTTICSPISAEFVLALLSLGCRNDSREELLKALDFPDDKTLRSSFAYITSALQSVQGATLNIANKVYIKKGGKLKPEIEKEAKKVFQSSLEQLDFNESQAAADAINKWVEQATNKKIRNVISPNMLNNQTAMVLVNAIYFQGTWVKKFNKALTRNCTFNVNKTTQIKVPQMFIEGENFKYKNSACLEAQLLQMDYKGGGTSMVIVLPKDIEGLGEVMKKLTQGFDLMAEIESLQYLIGNVTLPKFKIEMTIDLIELLPRLGIRSIFDPATSDVDMLTSNEKLYASQSIQRAFIDVNESGTEAAVCTVVVEEVCDREYPLNFTADRPFLYILIARKIPVFIGVYQGSEYACE